MLPASMFTPAPTMESPTKLKCASAEPANTKDDFSSVPGPIVQRASIQLPPRR
ncbi:hypothetical protein D3C87_1925290 [compost metagenome]